jgi:hypothetical protein
MARLTPIPEEPDLSDIEGLTRTASLSTQDDVADDAVTFKRRVATELNLGWDPELFTPGSAPWERNFGGGVYISVDSNPTDGETEEQRTQREARNADRARRRAEADAAAQAQAGGAVAPVPPNPTGAPRGGAQTDNQNPVARNVFQRTVAQGVARNLMDQFQMVEGTPVFSTLEDNIKAVTMAFARGNPDMEEVRKYVFATNAQLFPTSGTTTSRRSSRSCARARRRNNNNNGEDQASSQPHSNRQQHPVNAADAGGALVLHNDANVGGNRGASQDRRGVPAGDAGGQPPERPNRVEH